MLTRKVGYKILNEIKELELDYMEPDYMHMKCLGRGPGTSRNVKLMVKLHMVSVDMNEIVKRNFMLKRLDYFFPFKNVDT